MTTLNTIIEEEKKSARLFLRESPCNLNDEGFAVREEDLDSLLTTAMQRAYKAGVEDGKGTKTSDHATH